MKDFIFFYIYFRFIVDKMCLYIVKYMYIDKK